MFYSKKNGFNPGLIRILKSFYIIFSIFILFTIIATIIVGITIETTKISPSFGNKPDNIKKVCASADPNNFNFIVMGDVKDSTDTFENLLSLAEPERPHFLIILGDLVSHIKKVNHKLFVSEISEFQTIPFFFVPGNHDIALNSEFDVKDYREIYGSEQFYFNIGSNLFIFLNDVPGYNTKDEYLNFLESVLKANDLTNKKIFVFMHIPPGDLSNLLECSSAPNSERLKEIAKMYHIDYVFAGDHHGYVKTVKDGTTYIVSGGGGSRLRGTSGNFHHFVEMTIQNNNVTEKVVPSPHKSFGLELLEQNIAVYFWATALNNKLVLIISILYCGASIYIIPSFFKRK